MMGRTFMIFGLFLIAACGRGVGTDPTGGPGSSWSHGDGSKFGWIQVSDDYVSANFFLYTTPPYDNQYAYGCVAGAGGDDRAAVGAGDLTFTVAGQAPFTVAAPVPVGRYSSPHPFSLDKLTVSATGGTVPAFEADLTTSPPSSVQMIQPPIGSGSSPDVSRTTDLSLQWKGGTSGDLVVGISGSGVLSVGCVFPATDGHGTIPSTALAVLPVGERLYFSAQIADIVRFNAGDYRLSLVRWLSAGVLGCGGFESTTECHINLQP
jgi:hypothetical protein